MISSIETALVVDDDVLMREFIIETLKRNGLSVFEAANGLDAKSLAEERSFDIAFIDMKMPGMDGMQFLKFLKESGNDALPVMITAFGTVEQAVDAMKIGAYDFLMKPFSPDQVEIIIKRAREFVGIQARNAYLQEELGWQLPRGRQFIGQSPPVRALMEAIQEVAASSATVLVSGESGTGKELVALAIHALSGRKDGPFIRMNCAAVPNELMDSEMFGHEKGSFTSAISKRIGRFELANGGTLLLDEISELHIGLQAKLLRVLQEQEFERVGGARTIRTDCRVIATTNRNLKEYVETGKFRQDLFYRLNVLPINTPPLRERIEDIPILINAFLAKSGARKTANASELKFSGEAMSLLCAYPWPGNVRELENMVERLTVMGKGPVFGPDALPAEIRGATPIATVPAPPQKPETLNLAEIEREAIMQALGITGGNRQKTSDILGISVRTLRNKLNQYKQDENTGGM